jgi:hypothetical protein
MLGFELLEGEKTAITGLDIDHHEATQRPGSHANIRPGPSPSPDAVCASSVVASLHPCAVRGCLPMLVQFGK